jgi:hypothetical protein
MPTVFVIGIGLGVIHDAPGSSARTRRARVGRFFATEATVIGPSPRTFSLRELDGQYRHGAPVVYMDCSPTDVEWRGVVPGEALPADVLVGIVMLPPPDEAGPAYIARVEYGPPMASALLSTSEVLADLIHRLVRACLLNLAPGLADPLSVVADDDMT